MLNSETLEVAMGMAFLFLFVSIICTAVKEWLEGIFKWRAMDLERALRTLLADADGRLTSELLRHPLLLSLFPGTYDPAQLRSSWLTPGKGSLHMRLSQRRNLPSYIPATQFANALLDCVARGPIAVGANASAGDTDNTESPVALMSIESLRQGAQALASTHIQRVVLSALDHSAGNLTQARLNIERWFDGTMDRASGWYKRRTQAILFLLGLGMAVGMNIDAIHVMRRLTADKSFREVIVNEAAHVASPASSAPATQNERVVNARQALERVSMPIGWTDWVSPPNQPPVNGIERLFPLPRQLCMSTDAAPCQRSQWLAFDWWLVLCGWLATAFAVMLGAPFWFDVLNKFVVIRSTVKPHEKSPEESSEDRQLPKDKTPA